MARNRKETKRVKNKPKRKSSKKVTTKVPSRATKEGKKFEPPKIENYFNHNDDFTVVVLKSPSSEGSQFVLKPSQARAIKILFENFEKGIPWVSTDKLIESYDKQNSVQKVFKDIRNWETLIKVNTQRKGFYRLNLPFHPQMFIDGSLVFEEMGE